ncbi:MAG: hypothetical protein EBR82_18255 [Caulobacteraceae bacterium]|nr:hypothetical protein [Caulobacteraceae bacterium]
MNSGKPASEQDRNRIVRLREAGLSIRQIAHEQRCTTKTVQKILGTALAK